MLPLIQYWNLSLGKHFYTTNENELGQGKDGWVREETVGFIFRQQRTPNLYRFYSSSRGAHYYTTDLSDPVLGSGGWNLEGNMGSVNFGSPYAPNERVVPLYLYKGNNGDYYYTTVKFVNLSGYTYIKVACEIFK